MRNPLNHRWPRALRAELGKYIAIFLFMVLFIGFVSGFLVADGSMLVAYNESFTKYSIEDGHFRTRKVLTDEQRTQAEALGITLYDLPYVEKEADGGVKVRVYPWRQQVDLICLMQGREPAAADEIAVDRMWADNNHVTVGDQISLEGTPLTVVGLVAFSDYSCLFEHNSDMMFDAVLFCVGAMTEEGFTALADGQAAANYAYTYAGQRPADDKAEISFAQSLALQLNAIAPLEDFVPTVVNQAIQFTGEDMGSDGLMITVLLYILVAIMGFVFAMTARSTIQKEASVIGTLRASGCTRGELVRHYMLLPILVTAAAAVVGNILGYTWFKGISMELYYASYSLPTYVTVWSAEAFLKTTVVPVVIMLLVNVLVLRRALALPPIRFLRHDLRRGRQRQAARLNERWPFLRRFRTRIVLQNKGSLATLFLGILFADIILYFGLMLPLVLNDYEGDILSSMLARYQYVLEVPETDNLLAKALVTVALDTKNPGAEKYAVTTVETAGSALILQEDLTVYGLEPDSAYYPLTFDTAEDAGGEAHAFITDGLADKYGLHTGDRFTLYEKYGEGSYTFIVSGTCHYPAALALFLPRTAFNRLFGHEADYFNGYLTDELLPDVDERLVASVIDSDDLTKVSRQLMVSMGDMAGMVVVLSVLIYALLMYLLTRIIIERNAQSISMVKILGGTNPEIAGLYLRSTAAATFVSLLVCLPLSTGIITWVFKVAMRMEMRGWLPISFHPLTWAEMVLLGCLTFAAVALLEYRKILKVPMDAALKNVE